MKFKDVLDDYLAGTHEIFNGSCCYKWVKFHIKSRSEWELTDENLASDKWQKRPIKCKKDKLKDMVSKFGSINWNIQTSEAYEKAEKDILDFIDQLDIK